MKTNKLISTGFWDVLHRVAVEPVTPGVLEEVRHCEKIGHVVALLTVRSRIPGVVRPQHLHAFGVELVDNRFQTRRAAGHGANQIKRIAVVDPEVRVRRPDQRLVDATIALVQITEPFVNRVPRAFETHDGINI